MFRILFLLLLCTVYVAIAFTTSDAWYFVPAVLLVFLALRDAYYLGKGQPLTEDELPEGDYQVVHEIFCNGHTKVALLTKKGKLLICTSKGVEFTRFKLWGSEYRHLTFVSKKLNIPGS